MLEAGLEDEESKLEEGSRRCLSRLMRVSGDPV